jgi:dienelactone hydrolase
MNTDKDHRRKNPCPSVCIGGFKSNFSLVALMGCALFLPHGQIPLNASDIKAQQEWDSTLKAHWPEAFKVIQIQSSVDGTQQNSVAYQSTLNEPMPLVVSLHTWSGNFEQKDPLAKRLQAVGFNYIHPDFRGPNNTPDSCASKLALQDIDDAIAHCIENWNVDQNRIYVIGASGGGHATAAAYFNSVHPVSAFFAWVPITDISAWYLQSKQRGQKYYKDIESVCGGSFNEKIADERSPLMMEIPERSARLHLYAGINDGYTGSVPITHSIKLYNKLTDPEDQISKDRIIELATKTVEPTGTRIANREIWHRSESRRCTLTIFEGGHEMLVDYAAKQILDHAQKDASFKEATRSE